MAKLIAALVFLIALVVYFTGCESNKQTYTSIDPEFNIYVTEFNLLSGNIPYNVIIQFGVKSGSSGSCEIKSNGQKVINISRTDWDAYCVEQRRGVIFHELGHCVLGRSHTTSTASYMYAYTQTCEFYMANIPVLDNELFY